MSEALQMIRARLFTMQDPVYRDFQIKLIPTVPSERVIGVRTPQVRALARELTGTSEAELFLNALPHAYYDENNLHGFLIERIGDFEAVVSAINNFLPYVDIGPPVILSAPKFLAKTHTHCCLTFAHGCGLSIPTPFASAWEC